MEKCVDHPNNMAVEVCKQCRKLICGLHDTSLCTRHSNLSEKYGKTIIILLFFIGSVLIFVFLGLMNLFLLNMTDPDTTGGDSISTDPVTFTDGSSLPGFSTIILIFLGVAIPILVSISLVLYRLSKSADTSDPDESSTQTSFYCQRCGSDVSWQDPSCPNCGKNTDDERNLISKR